jgi:hypothetical protein
MNLVPRTKDIRRKGRESRENQLVNKISRVKKVGSRIAYFESAKNVVELKSGKKGTVKNSKTY